MNDDNVIESVDLRCFSKITPDTPSGGIYDIMEITPYKTSCRIRLPQIISEQLETDKIEIRINGPGTILVMLPGGDEGFEVRRKRGSRVAAVHSAKLAQIFANKKVSLPAKFRVVYDERIAGWVCRMVK